MKSTEEPERREIINEERKVETIWKGRNQGGTGRGQEEGRKTRGWRQERRLMDKEEEKWTKRCERRRVKGGT